jgi:heptosyltransferase-2
LTGRVVASAEVRRAHETRWYLDLLGRTLGIDGPVEAAAPDVDERASARMRSWLARHRRGGGRLIAVGPAAAYGPAKEWPAERYAAVVDLLAGRHGVDCVLVGAPAERSRCEAVAAASRHGVSVAAGETTVGELIALLALSDGFVGNDSGAMHVAGALGRPTVGIYGSTSPERTGPLGPLTRVLYRRIECSPCLERTCRFGHYGCFREIHPEEVVGALCALGAVG